MKRKILSILALTVTGFIILTGCSKEEDNAPAPKTKTQLLTQATWKFSDITWGGVNYTASLPACYKDNTLTFAVNGSGSADEGPTKCNGGDPQTNPFTWSFQAGETTLQASHPLLPGGSNTFTIVTLSETQLIVSQQWSPPGSGLPQQLAVVTFIH